MPAETHSRGDQLSRAEIADAVRGAIVECCGCDFDSIADGDRLVDLGVDDLVRLDLADILSEELGERNLVGVFDGEAFANTDTVASLIALVERPPDGN